MAEQIVGYAPGFLGEPVIFPAFDPGNCASLKKEFIHEGSDKEIRYTHFSLFQHRVRKLPLLAAVNISGEAYSAQPRIGGDDWQYCEQIEEKYQLDNNFYGKDLNTFDRGHIVRRVDPCWGKEETSILADKQTFNWANCTPQHKLLNQKGGIWFQLEQHIMEHGVKGKIADISVFAGPVLDKRDLNFIKPYKDNPIQIPSVFWKVIVYKKSDGKLYAVGFMMSQWEFIKDKMINGAQMEKAMVDIKESLPDDYFETLRFSDNKTYQVSLKEIQKATGITFNWDNVSFPFTRAKPQAITATPVETVRPYSEIFTELKMEERGVLAAGAKASIKTEVDLFTLGRLSAYQETYTVKQFEINNIIL